MGQIHDIEKLKIKTGKNTRRMTYEYIKYSS